MLFVKFQIRCGRQFCAIPARASATMPATPSAQTLRPRYQAGSHRPLPVNLLIAHAATELRQPSPQGHACQRTKASPVRPEFVRRSIEGSSSHDAPDCPPRSLRNAGSPRCALHSSPIDCPIVDSSRPSPRQASDASPFRSCNHATVTSQPARQARPNGKSRQRTTLSAAMVPSPRSAQRTDPTHNPGRLLSL